MELFGPIFNEQSVKFGYAIICHGFNKDRGLVSWIRTIVSTGSNIDGCLINASYGSNVNWGLIGRIRTECSHIYRGLVRCFKRDRCFIQGARGALVMRSCR